MIIRAALCVIGLALAPLHAIAAQSRPAPLWGFLGLGAPAETKSDISGSAGLSVSIAKAIDLLQQQTHGRVVEIGYSTKGGDDAYQAMVISSGALHSLRVDPATGAIARGNQPDITRDDLDPTGQRDLDAIFTSKIDLVQAVAAVEQTNGNRVVSAGIEQLAGIPQYYIQAVANGKVAPYVVNPQTGRVAAP